MSQGVQGQSTGPIGSEPAKVQAAAPREPAAVVRTERQALVMAASIFLVAIGSWGSAQFACNKHPPQYKAPTALTPQQLSSTAKDAAIELQQRELGGDLVGAMELADGALLAEMKAHLAQCQAAGNCGAKATVLTRAEVFRPEGSMVMVRTISLVGSQEIRALLKMERRGTVWKAVERSSE